MDFYILHFSLLKSIVETLQIQRLFSNGHFSAAIFTSGEASTRFEYCLKNCFHLTGVSTETKRAEETVVTSFSSNIAHSKLKTN